MVLILDAFGCIWCEVVWGCKRSLTHIWLQASFDHSCKIWDLRRPLRTWSELLFATSSYGSWKKQENPIISETCVKVSHRRIHPLTGEPEFVYQGGVSRTSWCFTCRRLTGAPWRPYVRMVSHSGVEQAWIIRNGWLTASSVGLGLANV